MAAIENSAPRSLLLLPPPPFPPTFTALKAAYGATLFSVLRELARSSSRSASPAVLEIALPCPHLYGQEDTPRSALYATTQSLVAGLYKLICVISARESIDVEDAEGVDAKIVLLAYPRNGSLSHVAEGSPESDLEGPVVGIQTLACSGRLWEKIYTVQTESGEQILKNFQAARKSQTPVQRLRAGITQVSSKEEEQIGRQLRQDARKHLSVAVGGTFDHLHIGHKLLLTMFAFTLDKASSSDDTIDRSLTVGITGDELLKNKKYAEFLESWDQRQKSTYEFLRSIMDFSPAGHLNTHTEELNEPGPNGHAVHLHLPSKAIIKCVEISDPFGPTITDETISALVLSAETRSGGKAVNSKRREKGWPDLEVFEVDILDAEEEGEDRPKAQDKVDEAFQSKLSSTEIRRMQAEKAKSRSKV